MEYTTQTDNDGRGVIWDISRLETLQFITLYTGKISKTTLLFSWDDDLGLEIVDTDNRFREIVYRKRLEYLYGIQKRI